MSRRVTGLFSVEHRPKDRGVSFTVSETNGYAKHFVEEDDLLEVLNAYSYNKDVFMESVRLFNE